MALTPPTGSNPWLVSSTISTQGSSYNLTLATAGQLLDRNIEVSVKANLTTRTPTFTSTALAINTITPSFSTNMTTSTTGTYYIEPSAFAQTNSPKVSYTNSAGYIAAHTNAAAITLASASSTVTGASVYIPAAAGIVTITGGTVKMSTPTTAHVSFSTTAPGYSGIYIKAIASQSAKISASVSITTSGYTPVNSSFASTSKAISTVSSTYYITGVTLENNSVFDITIPNGTGSTITLHFAVDASGNTTIGEGGI